MPVYLLNYGLSKEKTSCLGKCDTYDNYCASWFLTSVAIDQNDQDVFIPYGLTDVINDSSSNDDADDSEPDIHESLQGNEGHTSSDSIKIPNQERFLDRNMIIGEPTDTGNVGQMQCLIDAAIDNFDKNEEIRW